MKNQINILNNRRSLLFFLGILLAGFLVSQEIVNYQNQQICEEILEADEDQEEAPKKTTLYSLTAQVVLPVSGVELEPFQAILIGELIHEIQDKPLFLPEVALDDSPHFKTLFRQFQSPNAP